MPVAPPEAARLIMARALEAIPCDALSTLCPYGDVLRNAASREKVAEGLLGTRAALVDSSDTPDFAHVSMLPTNEEPDRWREMAEVERVYRQLLKDVGYADADDRRAEAVRAPAVPARIQRIVVAALPNLSGAFIAWLRNTGLPVQIIVAANAEDAAGFDEYGVPLEAVWTARSPAWDDFDAQVCVPTSPMELQHRLAGLFQGAPDGAAVTVILADNDLARVATQGVADAGGRASEAEGIPLDEHPHARLLKDWAEYLREPTWEALNRLLRRPAFAKWIAPGHVQSQVLRIWDEIEAAHLPYEPGQLLHIADASANAAFARELVMSIEAKARAFKAATNFSDAVTGLVRELGLEGSDARDTDFLEQLREASDELGQLVQNLGGITSVDALAMLVRRLSGLAYHPRSPASDVAVRGWLELLWEDSPHILILGLNEGRVPESLSADAFLPGSLREKLGLPGDGRRFACDAYALDRALRLRASGRGRADVFAPRHDNQGDPLRPSRLLFSGAGDALPARVRRLYAAESEAPPEPARTSPWKLLPRVRRDRLEQLGRTLPATAFRDYLSCPLRFYLSRVLQAEAVDCDRAEPDAPVFGNLVHEVLRLYGSGPDFSDLTDEAKVARAFDALLGEVASVMFGPQPSVAATAMTRAAGARLAVFAPIQARRRREGWRILEVETERTVSVALPDGDPVTVRLKIDRIDRHETDGRLCIMDYKTSNRGDDAPKAHLAPLGEYGVYPEWHVTRHALNRRGEPEARRWTDLQLPIYVESVLASGSAPIGAVVPAYVLLPEASTDTRIAEWNDYSPALHADAMGTLRAIVNGIRANAFRPHGKAPAYDDFRKLLGHAEVDFEAFERNLFTR